MFHRQRWLTETLPHENTGAVVRESPSFEEDGRGPADCRRHCVHRHARYRARGDRPLMNLPPLLETKFQALGKPLSGPAFGADSHAAVRAGPVRPGQ